MTIIAGSSRDRGLQSGGADSGPALGDSTRHDRKIEPADVRLACPDALAELQCNHDLRQSSLARLSVRTGCNDRPMVN